MKVNLSSKLTFSNVSSFQLFQVLRFAAVFVTGIFLARFGMPLKDIGLFETLLFFSGAVSFFWVGGILTHFLVKYKSQEGEHKLFSIFVLLSIISILVFLIIRLLKTWIIRQLSITGAEEIFDLFTFYILLNTPTFLIEYIFLAKEKSKKLFLYGILFSIFYIVSIIIPVSCNQSVEGVVKALIIFALLKIIFLIFLIAAYEKPVLDSGFLISHLKYSLPLIVSLLASGSADYIDAFLVSGFFGQEQVAVFRYGAKEFPLAVLLASGLSTASILQLTNKSSFDNGLLQLRKSATRLMHILFPVSMVLMLCSSFLYPLIYNPQFAASALLFNIYLLLLISRVIFPQTVLIALGKSQIILLASVLEIAVNITASVYFLKIYGIMGIAYGTLAAFFFEKLLLAAYLYVKLKIKPPEYINLRVWLTYSSLLLMAYFFTASSR